jgi:hypothetical protein
MPFFGKCRKAAGRSKTHAPIPHKEEELGRLRPDIRAAHTHLIQSVAREGPDPTDNGGNLEDAMQYPSLDPVPELMGHGAQPECSGEQSG